MNKLDLAAIRAEFPALLERPYGKPLAYLDNAATTQKPNAVLEATARAYREECGNVHRGVHLFDRDFGGDFNPPPRTFDPPASAPTGYISSSVSLVTIYIPPPTMIVIITIPAPSPQFSEPLTSSVKAPAQRQTQSTSFSSPPRMCV